MHAASGNMTSPDNNNIRFFSNVHDDLPSSRRGTELISMSSEEGHKQETVEIPENIDSLDNNQPPSIQDDNQGYTLFFRDGVRRIDLVLVYEEEYQGVPTEQDMLKSEKRRVFQENLIKEGLDLEIEECQNSFDEKTGFVKVHIPWKALDRYAEVMNLKKPIKVYKHLVRVNRADSLSCEGMNRGVDIIYIKYCTVCEFKIKPVNTH